jgi:hypothetical protein
MRIVAALACGAALGIAGVVGYLFWVFRDVMR